MDGDEAFAYYFPVLETCVRRPNSTHQGANLRFVAYCIEAHFDGSLTPEIASIAPRVNDLSLYVIEQMDDGFASKERERTIQAWGSIRKLSEATSSQDSNEAG